MHCDRDKRHSVTSKKGGKMDTRAQNTIGLAIFPLVEKSGLEC